MKGKRPYCLFSWSMDFFSSSILAFTAFTMVAWKSSAPLKESQNGMNEHFYRYWPLSLTTVTKGEKTFAGGGTCCCLESLGWDWGSQVPSRSPIPVDRLTQPPASLGERGFSSYTLKGNR